MPAQLFQMPGRRPAVNEQVGGHIPQGQQDKGPLCHARMRQGAEFRCAAFLTIEQQININGAGAVAQRRIRAAHTSEPLFQIQQGPQQLHPGDGQFPLALEQQQAQQARAAAQVADPEARPQPGEAAQQEGVGAGAEQGVVVNKRQLIEFKDILKKYYDTFAFVETVNETIGNFSKVK